LHPYWKCPNANCIQDVMEKFEWINFFVTEYEPFSRVESKLLRKLLRIKLVSRKFISKLLVRLANDIFSILPPEFRLIFDGCNPLTNRECVVIKCALIGDTGLIH